jgi:myo-inositol-1(or 4)-monophosphatase
MNLSEICKGIESIARETGNFIMSETEGFDIGSAERKGFNDYVTHVDRGAEKMLVEKLGKLIPEAGFLVEENTSSKKGVKYTWVVDPLDGTTNFIHGIHPYAISIGLMEHDEIIAGVVHEAAGEETFTAWKEGGAWLNGKKIVVSGADKASLSLIATGFPYKDFTRLDRYLKCLGWLLNNTHGVRRMGAASVDLAYVACGRYEVFFEYGLNPWDVAAGIILIREAGGIVSDYSGKQDNLTGLEILASNRAVYPEILEIISTFMAK